MIVYEVDFVKYKKENNIESKKEDNFPAQICKFEDNMSYYMKRACDCFNQGTLFQSAYFLNKVLECDKEKIFSSFDDCSILGLINFKLANFELAEYYLLKSLAIRPKNTVKLMLYHNSLHYKHFKLAERLKNEIEGINEFANLNMVKNENVHYYEEVYSFKNLFSDYINMVNSTGRVELNSLFEMLKIIDCDNPYIIKLEKDFINNKKRKYPQNFSKSLVKEGFDYLNSLKDLKSLCAKKIKGLMRFLTENCNFKDFEYYFTLFMTQKKLSNNFYWQCEDCLFRNINEDIKMLILEKLLQSKYVKVKNVIGFAFQDSLIYLHGVIKLKELIEISSKSAECFAKALCEFISLTKKEKNVFELHIDFSTILDKFIREINENKDLIEKMKKEDLKNCFVVSMFQFYGAKRNKKIKEMENFFCSKIKTLNIDFSHLEKVKTKENVVVVDF